MQSNDLSVLRAARQMHKSNEAKTDEILMQCADAIMACFRICASDTRTDIERSKRWGMLHVVNQLFKIYFKMNNVKLCKPLIRAIEGTQVNSPLLINCSQKKFVRNRISHINPVGLSHAILFQQLFV